MVKEEQISKDRMITARVRNRDKIIVDYFKSRGIGPTAILRAGLASLVSKLELVEPEEAKKMWGLVVEEFKGSIEEGGQE